MANEPVDMIMPMLREILSEMTEIRGEFRSETGGIKLQLDKLERGQKNIRDALTADSIISKFMIGDFENRIAELESKVETLMKGK